MPSSPLKKVARNAEQGSFGNQRKAVALNPGAPRIEGKGRPMRPADKTQEARERFARTFADVLSVRFGGRWAVEWQDAERSPLDLDRR